MVRPSRNSCNNYSDDEDDDPYVYDIGDQTWESHIITFFINCAIQSDVVLKDLQTDLQFTTQYKFHIYECLKKNNNLLDELLSILHMQKVDTMVIYELDLPDKMLMKVVSKIQLLRNRTCICYVLTSRTKIYANNVKIYQILAAIRQLSVINSKQPSVIEQPIYINTISQTNMSHHWECLDLANCNIADEELYKLYSYFCNVTVMVLNLSNNNLSLHAVVSFILNCRYIQTLHFDSKCYNEFDLCDILFCLLPSLICARDLQIKIKFKRSTVFILCGSQLFESHSRINDFLASAIGSSEPIHFLMLNCRFNVQDVNFLCALQGFSLTSSIHIHNTALQSHHLPTVIETLHHTQLFIVEKDFVFAHNSKDFQDHIKSSFREENTTVEINWHSCYGNCVAAFVFKEIAMFEDAIKMMHALKETRSPFSLRISNANLNDVIVEDIATLINMNTLSNLKLVNLNFTDQQVMFILECLKHYNSPLYLEIYQTNLANYCEGKLFSVLAKKEKVLFYIVESDLVVANHLISDDSQHREAEKGVRFELVRSHFSVFIAREMATIKNAIKLKYILKETRTLTSFSISNAHVTDDQAENIATFLHTEIDTLTKINIKNINLCGNRFSIILKHLQDANSLTHLVINSINVVNHCQDELCSIIAENEQLCHLEISNCNLKEPTIIKLAEAIFIISKSLRNLILSCNNISDAAAAKLATALRTATFLTHLDVSNTSLQLQGIISIAQSLEHNANLESFCINNCSLSTQAVNYIVSCILNLRKSLKCLEMSNCKLEETSILDITTALARKSSLCAIDLSLNKITDKAAAMLANIINKNLHISCLKLSMNGLNENSVYNVLTSCKKLAELSHVDLNFAHFIAPVSEENDHNMVLSIDNIIQHVTIEKNDDEDDDYTYISLMNDIEKQLTHLTLSNCCYMEIFSALVALSSLEQLDVNSSTIPFTAISTTIENNASLKHINISNCCLQDHMFYEIAKALSHLMHLRHLNISGIRINNTAANFVAATISNNPKLYHLDLSKCQIQSNGLMKIVKDLKHLKDLSYLDMGYNSLTAEAANEIAYVFSKKVELEHLSLTKCNLREQPFLSISNSLATMNGIRHLNLSNNSFNIQSAIALSNCINENSNIEYLDLSNCDLSQNKVTRITATLKLLTSIKHLNISSSCLNNSAVDDLAFAIENNTGIEYLDFSNCQVLENGMLIILQKLLLTHTLKGINFQSTPIQTKQVNTKKSKNVATILIRIIINNKSLEYVNVSNCGLSTLEVTYLMKAQSVLSNLIHINISHNDVNVESAGEIASVIMSNKSLEVLVLRNCSLAGNSMSTVVKALALSKHLRVVDLSNNIITEKDTSTLASSLCNIATLEHLDIASNSLESNKFFATLNANKNFYFKLKHINLSSNEITCKASLELSAFVDYTGMIEYLDLSNCCITADDEDDPLYYVFSAFHNSNSLKYLNIKYNKLTEKAARTLYNVVCINQELQVLNLSQCYVPGSWLDDILEQCRALISLDVGYNEITDQTAYLISSAISNGLLDSLNIENCILQEDGNDMLIEAMAEGTSMQFQVAEEEVEDATIGILISTVSILVFEFGIDKYNLFTKEVDVILLKPIYFFKLTSHHLLEDVKDFIESINGMEIIEYFSVSYCDLRDHNFYKILPAIQQCCTLKYLLLKSVSIPDEGVSNIVSAITSSKIIHVDLCDCNLSESQILLIVESLATLSSLKHLNISDNEISMEIINALATAIKNNKFLQHLCLSNCGIEDVRIQVICNALSNFTSLLSLGISNNYISNDSVVYIATVLYNNKALQHLDVTNCFAKCLYTISHVHSKMQGTKNLSLENNWIDDYTADTVASIFISPKLNI